MGETAADARREIEETRSELGGTVRVLRARAGGVRAKAVRASAVAGGAVVLAGAAGAAALVAKRRRGGSISRAARRFPRPARPPAVSAARGFERWLAARSKRVERQRTELVDSFARRLADNQAQAERRANPLWRRAVARALETAATVGVTEVVRKVVVERGTRPAEPVPR